MHARTAAALFSLTLFLPAALPVRAADPAPAAPNDLRRGFADVARKALPAVVFIQTEKTIQRGGLGGELSIQEFMERFFGMPGGPRFRGQPMPEQRPFIQLGQGSGFIISKDGYILTNTHVVGDADKIMVRLQNGKEYAAKRVGVDDRTEIAVIKIDAGELPTVELGDTSKLEVGEWVIAIGTPFGLDETVTVGVVSAKGRSGMGIADFEDFIQTDAAINPGNSGGPLLNIDGKVVGINTAIFSRSGGYMGIGFAVPIDMAVGIKDQLITHGKVTRGYLGIAMNPGEIDEEIAKSLGLPGPGGVLVADVMPDTAAGKAGLQAGDVIVELNGKPVKDGRTFRSDVAAMRPGTEVKLTVFRDGDRRTITAAVGTAPASQGRQQEEEPESQADIGKLGLEVQDTTAEELRRMGYPDGQGVLITDVTPGGAAFREGLRPGMLIIAANQKPVNNLRELREALRGSKPRQIVRLRVRSPEGARYVFIRPE